MPDITSLELKLLKEAFQPLVGFPITWLSIPEAALHGFEPSQLAVIVNTLLDGILPQIEHLATDTENADRLLGSIGLSKSPGEIGERESYPDYVHVSGKRVELKGLFVDNAELAMKRPPTQREPSARLKENVTIDVIDPANDALLVAATQLQADEFGACSPYIIDIEVFSMVECVRARDKRLADAGGKWFGSLAKGREEKSLSRHLAGHSLTDNDYEKDTNFGKLKRIPFQPLQDFLHKHGGG